MKTKGYDLVTTSSLSNEAAQHFYRKLNYMDSSAILLPEEPLKIIFVKKLQVEVIIFIQVMEGRQTHDKVCNKE